MKKYNSEEPRGTHLEWVPTWEGVLKYCPEDLKNDVPLRFWHCYRHKGYKRKVCIQLTISFCHCRTYSSHSLPRRKIMILHRGKTLNIKCAILTYLCIFGFRPVDKSRWVVDHINGNSMDDRPSNLQLISQKENLAKSSKCRKINKLSNAEKKRLRMERLSKIDEMRMHIIAAMGPEAKRIDVEIELAQRLQELEGGETS